MDCEILLNPQQTYIAENYHGCRLTPHRHYEIEIIYCFDGCIHFLVNGIPYDVFPNSFIIIPSMAIHSSTDEPNSPCTLIRIGPTLLRNLFLDLSSVTFPQLVFSPMQTNEDWVKEVGAIFASLHDHINVRTLSHEFLIMSDICRLCSVIAEAGNIDSEEVPVKRHQYSEESIKNIIQYICGHFQNQITLDDVAALSGYTKEHFCKLFKDYTGETFLTFLTFVRINHAKYLLSNTQLPIKAISEAVGFRELKTFDRSFKAITNTTATDYRKRNSLHQSN